MINATELSACPFCGETPIEDGKSECLRIRCESCGVQGPSFYFDGEDDADIERASGEAIAAWNRRAKPVALTDEEIIKIGMETHSVEPSEDGGLFLPIKFARAILAAQEAKR